MQNKVYKMKNNSISIALRVHGVKRKLGKPPKWVYPASVEVAYRKILYGFVEKMKEEFKKIVMPHLPQLVAQAGNLITKMDAWSGDLDAILDNFQESIDGIFPNPQAMEILTTISQNVNKFNAEQWYKICKAVLGVDIYSAVPQLQDRMLAFVHDNVTLIKDVKAQVYKDVRLTVSQGIREGLRQETIAKNILADTDLTRGVFAKVKTRATVIARDQVGKLNGDMAFFRQTDAGINEYYWNSLEDERVVGTPGGRFPNPSIGHGNHYLMDGTLCKWSNPNIYSKDDGKTWIPRPENMKGAIPGSQYSCRCYASPKFGKEFQNVR